MLNGLRYSLKQVNERYDTIQEPGQSGRSSGGGGVVVVVVVVGLGLLVVAALVLSQQTEPRLQFHVCGMSTLGRSQKAAMMLSRQKPGHLGRAGVEAGRWVVVVVVGGGVAGRGRGGGSVAGGPAGLVMQQLSSPGQWAWTE